MIRRDFPMFRKDDGRVYLDNAATTFKPDAVIDEVTSYYSEHCYNSGRSTYAGAIEMDEQVESVRSLVAEFIGCDSDEVVFTSGASDALNLVALSFGRATLSSGDVVITTRAEHASCILPWMKLCSSVGAKLVFAPLDEAGRLDLEGLAALMGPRVKAVVLAQVTNVLGYEVPVREVCGLAHAAGAVVVVDGAQSVGHLPVDVRALGCDFLAFSAHKMCGPTGIGVLYGKRELLRRMDPVRYGGGSNVNYDDEGGVFLRDAPYRFECGTLPLAQVCGLGACVRYLDGVGMEAIAQRTCKLRSRAVTGLADVSHVEVLNPGADGGIVTFNVRGVFSDDAATYLDAQGVCVRSGQHCSRLLEPLLHSRSTLRASVYFYNSEDEIDQFVACCAQASKAHVYDVIFS